MFKKISTVALLLTLSACATKSYPIAQPLSDSKAMAMTCSELFDEISDIDALSLKISEESKTDLRSAGAFLMDFGIGNAIAKDNAMKAMQERKVVINNAISSKACAMATTEQSVAEGS